MANTNVSTKVVTGEVRFSYVNVFEPKSINGSDEKYSVSLLIDKRDTKTIEAIERAIEAAKQAGVAKFGGKIPPVLKLPLRDGDAERPDDENYAGKMFVNANCKTKPGLIEKNGMEIINTAEFYSGCYGKASVTFYAFNSNGNKGIACGLNNIMKTRDGEPLGGRSRAVDDFANDIEEDDIFG
ncbi:DUF2815 family protein [Ruminococcus bromii]|nr:DUF2815 family protein [Ruminococcus bromii]RGU84257.1 DUF2815 family protein [Ruminococcus bromii]